MTPPTATPNTPTTSTAIRRAIDALRRGWCGFWRAHDRLPQFTDGRMFLRCMSCGHETPGWELNEVPPTVTAPVRRLRARPTLVSARRVG
jgi:hypothetical protein